MSNIIHQPAFIPMMLEYAFRSPRWLENVSVPLHVEAFDDRSEAAFKVLWHIAREFWKENKRPIPPNVLEVEIMKRASSPDLSREDLEQMLIIAGSAYEKDESEFAADYMIRQTQLFINERLIRPRLALAAEEKTENLEQALADTVRALAAGKTSTGTRTGGFTRATAGFKTDNFKPTGLGFLDVALGGGITPSVGGLLGGSNAGKTVLAIQLACTAARTFQGNETVLLFGYENPINPNYLIRAYTYLAATGRKMPRDFSEWSAEDKEKVFSILDEIEFAPGKTRFEPVDMVGSAGSDTGCGGVPEIVSKVKSFQDAGHDVKLVIVDQHQPMAEKFLGVHGGRNDTLRDIMKRQVVETGAELAAGMGVTTLYLHQWAPDIALKTAYWQKPKLQEAAECKSWPSWMDWAFSIGNPDPNGVRWFANTKNRTNALVDSIVRMNGEMQRFEYQEGRYEVRNRRFVDTLADTERYSAKPDDRKKPAGFSRLGAKCG